MLGSWEPSELLEVRTLLVEMLELDIQQEQILAVPAVLMGEPLEEPVQRPEPEKHPLFLLFYLWEPQVAGAEQPVGVQLVLQEELT